MEAQNPAEPPTFRCEPCNKSFAKLLNLQQHLRRSSAHSTEVHYCPDATCPRSTRGFARAYYLARHLKSANHPSLAGSGTSGSTPIPNGGNTSDDTQVSSSDQDGDAMDIDAGADDSPEEDDAQQHTDSGNDGSHDQNTETDADAMEEDEVRDEESSEEDDDSQESEEFVHDHPPVKNNIRSLKRALREREWRIDWLEEMLAEENRERARYAAIIREQKKVFGQREAELLAEVESLKGQLRG